LNSARSEAGEKYDKLVLNILFALWRHTGTTSDSQHRVFDIGEAMGVHVTPCHFYSPVPTVGDLPSSVWETRFDDVEGVDYSADKFLAILPDLAHFAQELSDTPLGEGARHQFHWNNPAFVGLDALAYYGMIRHFQSQRIVEVGSGYSTLLAARAARKNGFSRLECVEPYPYPWLRDLPGLTELIEKPVQEIDLSLFTSLQANDILFIDNSHVCKIGSDVNHVILQVLPRLQPGVIVHFHDIYLPFEFPQNWVKQLKLFWNEQYLLHAFLLFNDQYEALLGNQLLERTRLEEARRFFPWYPEAAQFGGGSFWIRRRKIA
jgi:hypothetical protein